VSEDRSPAPRPGWSVSTLGELCDKPEYGWTTRAATSGDLRFLRTTDISRGIVDWATVPFCAVSPPDPERYLLRPGDIVISRAGSVGLSALVNDTPDAVFASYLIRFRPRRTVEARYIRYFLQTSDYWAQIAESAAGIALQNVNAKKLAAISLPVAPLPEQRRIVAEIEKHFTRLEAAVTSLQRARANLRRYRAAVLKAACEGHLVPTEAELTRAEGRDYEPAPALLERLRSSGADSAKVGQLRPLPPGWCSVNLGLLLAEHWQMGDRCQPYQAVFLSFG
jgi:type I restriction enzyme, S subunit